MIAGAVLILTISGGMAMAHAGPASDQVEASSGVDDIVVTAQRREQRLQDGKKAAGRRKLGCITTAGARA